MNFGEEREGKSNMVGLFFFLRRKEFIVIVWSIVY